MPVSKALLIPFIVNLQIKALATQFMGRRGSSSKDSVDKAKAAAAVTRASKKE
jgi:hypothetical protein